VTSRRSTRRGGDPVEISSDSGACARGPDRSHAFMYLPRPVICTWISAIADRLAGPCRAVEQAPAPDGETRSSEEKAVDPTAPQLGRSGGWAVSAKVDSQPSKACGASPLTAGSRPAETQLGRKGRRERVSRKRFDCQIFMPPLVELQCREAHTVGSIQRLLVARSSVPVRIRQYGRGLPEPARTRPRHHPPGPQRGPGTGT